MNRHRPAWLAVLLLFLGSFGTAVAAQPDTTPAQALAAWSRVLQQRVDEAGRVDYAGLVREPQDLNEYVAWLAANGPKSSPALFPTRQHLLAHYINAYNALAMHSVIDVGVPESLYAYGRVRFFWLRQVRVDGERLSLHSYEKRIRALGDERIHFALNCMSVGCPRLPRTPFRPETVEQELERETRAFFAEPRNLQVDAARRVMRVSEILRFYTDEFLLKAPSLVAYVNNYIDAAIPAGYTVEFIAYDWTVANQTTQRSGAAQSRN